MNIFLERHQAGEHIAVWDELMALGEGVRHQLYDADAAVVQIVISPDDLHKVNVNGDSYYLNLPDPAPASTSTTGITPAL